MKGKTLLLSKPRSKNFCVVLCIVCFVSFYVLFVCNVYCTTAIGCQTNCSLTNISYHIFTATYRSQSHDALLRLRDNNVYAKWPQYYITRTILVHCISEPVSCPTVSKRKFLKGHRATFSCFACLCAALSVLLNKPACGHAGTHSEQWTIRPAIVTALCLIRRHTFQLS
jgi:hypothetical protein